MIYTIFVLISGIFIGQEYNILLPSVKTIVINALIFVNKKNGEKIQETDTETYFMYLLDFFNKLNKK